MTEVTSKRNSQQADLYPSRTGDKPHVIARLDPVVYGTAAEGPLDQSALDLYEENGFLHFESMLSSKEIESCARELGQLRVDEALKNRPEVILESEDRTIRSIFAVHEISDVMRSLCSHPKLVAIAEQLLGSEVYVHQSRINYKGGLRGKGFYWHSDFETWHVEDGLASMRTVSCSISLTENTPHNGALMIIPGSHHHFIACAGETPKDHYKASLKRQDLGVPDDESLTRLVRDLGIVSPVGPIGSVTYFECNVMHGSNSNITPIPRSNLFIVYNSIHNKLVAPFCGLAPRPNFIAEREKFVSACRLSRF